MAYELKELIVIGISSSALFDLKDENKIYDKKGLQAYIDYQIKHENKVLKPGTGFKLIKALLRINELMKTRKIEVILMSKNPSEASLRIFNSIDYYGLDIKRAIFTSGYSLTPYFRALKIDLFLSSNRKDVLSAMNADIASALVFDFNNHRDQEINEIRIAFDGDAVLFSNDSELIYQEKGLEAFSNHEKENRLVLLKEGPFASFIKMIHKLQIECKMINYPIFTSLVTSRSYPAHERVLRTLRSWDISIDEVFFLGGIEKSEILKAKATNNSTDEPKIVIINPISSIRAANTSATL